MYENRLLLVTIAAVVIGVALGFIMRAAEFNALQRYYWGYPGDVIMMNMLKCIIVPLIVFSIVTGVASLAESSGVLSLYAVIYYLTTTILAIILGIIMSVAIKPGKNVNRAGTQSSSKSLPTKSVADGLLDIIRNMFPNNIIQASFEQASSAISQDPAISKAVLDFNSSSALTAFAYTNYMNQNVTYVAWNDADYRQLLTSVTTKTSIGMAWTLWTPPLDIKHGMEVDIKPDVPELQMVPSIKMGGSQNVLGLIVFCSAFGFYLGKLAKNNNSAARSALLLFNGLNDAIMCMVDLIMYYVPIGLLFLISRKIMDMPDDMGPTWAALGLFVCTSIVSLLIHGFIVLPLIYFLMVRKNPFRFLKGVLQAMVTAFANASSAATMPITMRNLEMNLLVDPRVTRFMLPLGATINMDGTALYEAVAALFIAQLSGVNLSFGQIITVAVTSTAASIGAAAVPSAGLITLIIVLTAVDLPTDDIALILTIDWFLDRIRTAINVWGDSVGCGIVSHLCRDVLSASKAEYLTGNVGPEDGSESDSSSQSSKVEGVGERV